MNKRIKRWLLTWGSTIIVAFLILLLIALIASAYDIGGGDTLLIDCDNCSIGDFEHENETISVNCLYAAGTNATCSVHKDLEGGEYIDINKSPCDVNVSCDATRCGRFQDVEYNTFIKVKKENETLKIQIEVYNFKDESVKNWTSSYDLSSVVDQKDQFPYLCPQEVITEVNMQTCAQYLEKLYKGESVLAYESMIAASGCIKALSECQADYRILENKEDSYELLYTNTERDRKNIIEERDDCLFDLSNPNGDCTNQKDKIYTEERNNANMWFTIAIITSIFAGIVILKSWVFTGDSL